MALCGFFQRISLCKNNRIMLLQILKSLTKYVDQQRMIRKYAKHIYIPTALALAHFNLLPSIVAFWNQSSISAFLSRWFAKNNVLKSLPFYILWGIWHMRNINIFYQKDMDVRVSIIKIIAFFNGERTCHKKISNFATFHIALILTSFTTLLAKMPSIFPSQIINLLFTQIQIHNTIIILILQ